MPFAITKPPFPILQRTHRLAQGLIRAWLFTDSGAVTTNAANRDLTVIEQTGSGNNATFVYVFNVSHALQYQAGPSGLAGYIPPLPNSTVRPNVTLGNNAELNALLQNDEFSVAGWFKCGGQGSGSQWSYIFSKGYGGSGPTIPLGIYVNWSTGGLIFDSYQTTSTNALSYVLPTATDWYHFVAIRSKRRGVVELWVNGTLVSSQTLNGTVYDASNVASWNLLSLGSTLNRGFNGRIDSLLVYNRGLSRDDARALYQDQYQMFRQEPFGTQIFKVNPVVIPGGTTFNQAVTATAAAATAFVRSAGKIIAATSAGATSWLKGIGKAIAATSTGTTTATKSIAKPIAATATTATLWTSIKVKLVSIAATCAGTVSRVSSVAKRVFATSTGATTLVRSIGKPIAATSAGSVSVLKSVGKRVFATAAGVLSIVPQFISGAGNVFNQSVNATVSGTVTIRRAVGKLANIGAVGAVSLAKAITSRVFATGAASVSVVKSITKRVFATVASATVATAIKVFLVTISAVSSGAVSVRRAVGKVISPTLSGTVTIRRAMAMRLNVLAAASTSVAKSIAKRVLATASGVASAVAHIGSYVYQVTINVQATTVVQWLVKKFRRGHNPATPRTGHHVANPRNSGWPANPR